MGVFIDPSSYPFQSGHLLVGTFNQDGKKYPVGIKTERHAITFAGTGAGKGAAVLIPNAKLWPHNLLVIDPKGEVAEATVAERKKLGQNVYVIDPFESAKVPKTCRASFNPLSGLDANSPDIKEDIEIISDGIVKRDNPEASHWDDGAQAIISGLIAFLLLRAPKNKQNLIELRAIIRNGDAFAETMEEMKNLQGCAGLCESGASAAYAKEGGYFVSNAEKNTRWLDSPRMKNSLAKTTFSMAEIKNNKTSIYLVLPAKQLKNHGRFLRLFIRCALSEMMNPTPSGEEKGEECLFLLDEFFALGFIEEIMVSIGLMRSMGLKLWPVLQDLAQLEKLYGREGTQTFFGNSDVHQFFGNMDALTLDYISTRLGNMTMADIGAPPVWQGFETEGANQIATLDSKEGRDFRELGRRLHEISLREYEHNVGRSIGKPRVPPDEIAGLVVKEGEGVAIGQIVFVFGLKPLYINLLPFFKMEAVTWSAAPPLKIHSKITKPVQKKNLFVRFWEWVY